jgi:hypothetical protein
MYLYYEKSYSVSLQDVFISDTLYISSFLNNQYFIVFFLLQKISGPRVHIVTLSRIRDR